MKYCIIHLNENSENTKFISHKKNSSKKPASFRVKSKQHSSTIYNSLPLKETAFKGFCESPK